MKTLSKLSILILGVTLIATTQSCKRGENDPIISLRSRTNRITGEWKLSKGDITNTYTWNGNVTTSVYSFDGSTVIITESGSPPTTETYSFSITIDKNGTYNATAVTMDGITREEGLWNWMGKNKEAKMDNKEAIIFSVTRYFDEDGDAYSYTGAYGSSMVLDYTWVLQKLSDQEIEVVIDYSETDPDGDSESLKGTIVLEKN